MRTNKKTLLAVLAAFVCWTSVAQDENKQPTPEEMAEKETERLERTLKLEDWQVFYVDSTLVHDYSAWMEELNGLRKARVENSDLYVSIQDKWMERIEDAYRKFFTEAQWQEYLKQGGERIIRERQKRRDKAAGIKPEKKKKTR